MVSFEKALVNVIEPLRLTHGGTKEGVRGTADSVLLSKCRD